MVWSPSSSHWLTAERIIPCTGPQDKASQVSLCQMTAGQHVQALVTDELAKVGQMHAAVPCWA